MVKPKSAYLEFFITGVCQKTLQQHDDSTRRGQYEGVKRHFFFISDYALRTIIPPQQKDMSALQKIMCGCKCSISAKSMHDILLICSDSYLNKLKNQRLNSHNRSSGEMTSSVCETYKNAVIKYGHNIKRKHQT